MPLVDKQPGEDVNTIQPKNSYWAATLAELIQQHVQDIPDNDRSVNLLDIRVVGPEELVVTFKALYSPLPDTRAVRIQRHVIEANDFLGNGCSLREVALNVAVLALEEPRSLGEYDRSADGIHWLPPEKWLP